MSPAITGDLLINGIAIAGVGIYVIGLLSRPDRGPLERRIIGFLLLVLTLLIVRSSVWALDRPVRPSPTEIVAPWVPLGILVLMEGLMRRHVARWLKLLATLGALALSLFGLLRSEPLQPLYATCLAVFLLLCVGCIGWSVLRRDRGGLSADENAVIDNVMLILIVTLPLLITDFRTLIPEIPVRLGALGLLLFAFACVRLTATGGSMRLLVGELLAVVVLSGLAVGALRILLGELSDTQILRIWAVLLAAVLALAIGWRVWEERRRTERLSLLTAMAASDESSVEGILNRLLGSRRFRGMRLLSEPELVLYSVAELRNLMLREGVVSLVRAARAGHDAVEWHQVEDLLRRHDASHACLIGNAPLKLLLVNLARLGDSSEVELELRAFSRLATAREAARV